MNKNHNHGLAEHSPDWVEATVIPLHVRGDQARKKQEGLPQAEPLQVVQRTVWGWGDPLGGR